MGLSDFLGDDDPLDQEDVAKKIEEHTGVEPIWATNGPRFYAERDINGDGKDGTLFAAVLPGPRLYVDPTAKNDIDARTPGFISDDDMFESVTGTWDDSFGYSVMLDEDIPDKVISAVEWSYERFLTVA